MVEKIEEKSSTRKVVGNGKGEDRRMDQAIEAGVMEKLREGQEQQEVRDGSNAIITTIYKKNMEK